MGISLGLLTEVRGQLTSPIFEKPTSASNIYSGLYPIENL
jgi:hypothetical protein